MSYFSSGTGVCLGHCIIFCLLLEAPRYGGRHILETELVYICTKTIQTLRCSTNTANSSTKTEEEVTFIAMFSIQVHFGEEQVFEIPSTVPKHVLESVEIQTSPMYGLTSDLHQSTRAEMAEMSVQTTPGLALRHREMEKTPSRVPFKESLKQPEQEKQENEVLASEMAEEVVVKEAKAGTKIKASGFSKSWSQLHKMWKIAKSQEKGIMHFKELIWVR